jgi:hypothetical protein
MMDTNKSDVIITQSKTNKALKKYRKERRDTSHRKSRSRQAVNTTHAAEAVLGIKKRLAVLPTRFR